MSFSASLPIEIQASLDALRQRLLAELPLQQQKIEIEFAEWIAQSPLPEAPLTLVRAVHNLSGRAGMYGLDELFRLSQALEVALIEQEKMPAVFAFSAWRTYLCEKMEKCHSIC